MTPTMNRRQFLDSVATLGATLGIACNSRAVAQQGQEAQKDLSPEDKAVLAKVQPKIDLETFYPGISGEVRYLKSLDVKEWQAALSKPGPALIVPLVGGVLDLKGEKLKVTGGNFTVLGQFASSPIIIIGGETRIQASDIRFDHISMRPGDRDLPKKGYDMKRDGPWEPDGLAIYGEWDGNKAVRNFVASNCEFAWAVDENASVTGKIPRGVAGAASDIIFDRCLFSSSLNKCPTHSKNVGSLTGHGCGLLVYDMAQRVAVTNSIFESNPYRNPMVKAGCSVLVEGCLIVNPGSQIIKVQPVKEEYDKVGEGKLFAAPTLLVRNTICIRGKNTPAASKFIETLDKYPDVVTVYVDGNTEIDTGGLKGGKASPVSANTKTKLVAFGLEGGRAQKMTACLGRVEYLVETVGPQPGKRDSFTKKVMQSIRDGTSGFIDSQNDVGGYPSTVSPSAAGAMTLPSDPNERRKVIDARNRAVGMRK